MSRLERSAYVCRSGRGSWGWLNLALLWLLCGILTTTCASGMASLPTSPSPGESPTPFNTSIPAPTSTSFPPPSATPAPTPQARLTVLPSGPDLEGFAPGISPLTGLAVEDPALLDLPAVLVSISNMPPTARPQAGLSFAPWIYELFIGEGTTRFMSVFYGSLPRRIPNPSGNCDVEVNPVYPQKAWIGNRVWLDENQNGKQDPWEAGVGGICVSLYGDGNYEHGWMTRTDSNGYFGFNLPSDSAGKTLDIKSYELAFDIPLDTPAPVYRFTNPNVGNDDEDSDADPLSGRTQSFAVTGTNTSVDAGLVLVNPPEPSYAVSDIAPQRTYVGPIRSGRLTYNDFVHMYPAGCLVYASAGDGIRQQLQGCEIIFGEQPGQSPNTALLDVSHLKELAQKSKIANQPVNYSGHLFDPQPPVGGLPATSLWTYFHAFSQALWQYDPLSGSYLRQTDDGDGRGIFHTDTDRLTGRQLAFDNLAVILANYDVFRHGQYDIALCCGLEGYAFLFRDGQMYKIRWSTNNRVWEQKTGLLRPLHFTGEDKQPFPLKPGRTWVSVMTINSALKDLKDGKWQAVFAMPDDFATPDP